MARVVLTQPAPRVDAIATRLRSLGHQVLALALTRIVARPGDAALREAIARLDAFDWAVLVSPTAVQAAARLAPEWPASTGVAVVGPGSRAALADAAFRRAPNRVLSPVAPPYDGEALIALPPLRAPSRVLVLRGESGSNAWIDALRARGAQVEVHAVYRHEPLDPAAQALSALRAWLDEDAPDLPRVRFVVTQTATVARLDAVLEAAGLRERALHAVALPIHARIASALCDAGWRDVRLIEPGESALALALIPRSTTAQAACAPSNRHDH